MNSLSIVPIEVAMDERLSVEQMRVIIALYSFKDKATNLVPVRLQDIDAAANVPEVVDQLQKLGWVRKNELGEIYVCVPKLEK